MSENLRKVLHKGLQALSLTMDPQKEQQLIDFLYLLQKWNKAYNLTAIRSLDQMLTHHLLDSLVVAPFVTGERILDVGTGAGFPGIPLAVYYPQKQFVLLDSQGKKIRFLFQAQTLIHLENIQLVQQRVEKFRSEVSFDVIICRAVGDMKGIMQASRHLLSENGRWLFMKGTYPQDELSSLPSGCPVLALNVPGVDAKRHLVVIPHAFWDAV